MPKYFATSKGQLLIAVPQSVAREYGLKPGDPWEFKRRKNGIDIIVRCR